MELTRRELCLALPGVLLPAFRRLDDPAQQAPPLPSTMYPYDKLPVQTSNDAQFRAVLKASLQPVNRSRYTKRRCHQVVHHIRHTTTRIPKCG
jgi:hypothetical protein